MLPLLYAVNGNLLYVYIYIRPFRAQTRNQSKVGVGPMFTFYISRKWRKNLFPAPNRLYHKSFQFKAGPDFLATVS